RRGIRLRPGWDREGVCVTEIRRSAVRRTRRIRLERARVRIAGGRRGRAVEIPVVVEVRGRWARTRVNCRHARVVVTGDARSEAAGRARACRREARTGSTDPVGSRVVVEVPGLLDVGLLLKRHEPVAAEALVALRVDA